MAYGLVVLTIAAIGGFVAAVGDPVDWIEKRSEEFQNTGSPDFSESSSRFTFNAGSERYDQWRVAFDDFKEEPLLGDGGGGFNYSYTRKREYAELYVHDAHSIEMELLSELGIVGLVLFMIAIAAAIVGVVRSRTSRAAAHLGAIALASGGYWLTHTSVDWFWAYPARHRPGTRACRVGMCTCGGRHPLGRLQPGRPGSPGHRARGLCAQHGPVLALRALRQQRVRRLADEPRSRLR